MNPECERFREWLDEASNLTPAGAAEAHASACDACRRFLEVEKRLRRLGAGAGIDPARHASLVERIAPARARSARSLLRWVLPAAAAAAAIVVAVVFLWPAPPRNPPVLVTEIFGDLLGPLAEAKSTEMAPAAPAAADPLGIGDVLASIWGDIQGPLGVGLDAMKAPRAAATIGQPVQAAETKSDRTVKEN